MIPWRFTYLCWNIPNIANRASVTIKRNIGGKISVFKVNAKKLAEGKADYDVQVQPGDIITVAESLF
jgi:hypothetical protein